MPHELVRIALQIAVACAVCGLVLLGRRRVSPPRRDATRVAAIGLAALLVVSLGLHLRSAASALNQARQRGVATDRSGAEHCFEESLSGQPLVPQRAPFLDWVKAQLPAGATYAVSPYGGPPDLWCVTLALLPALPASAGEHARWTIAMGAVTPALAARIARHDPDVRLFAPGYALVRNPPR